MDIKRVLAIGSYVGNGTAGAIMYLDANKKIAQDVANLWWDDTNNRLGVGIGSSLLARVHIVGETADSTTNSVLVEGSTGSDLFIVQNDGHILFSDGSTRDIINQQVDFAYTETATYTPTGASAAPKLMMRLSNRSLAADTDALTGYYCAAGGLWYTGVITTGGNYGTWVWGKCNGAATWTEVMRLQGNAAPGMADLGLGTTAPTARMHVKGSGATSATTGLIIENSAGTDALIVRDDGLLAIGDTVTASTRLTIRGTGATSATTALLVENSAGTDALTVRDDGIIDIPATAFATGNFGIISKGGSRFIHNFSYGNNGTVTTENNNTFVGILAGNLTMGSTATAAHEGSRNTAFGYNTLTANTKGFSNVAVGTGVLGANTEGSQNVGIGYATLNANTTGGNSVAIGVFALQSCQTVGANFALGYAALRYMNGGTGNIAIGVQTMYNMLSSGLNVAIGTYSLLNSTSGSNNLCLGYSSGRFISGGVTALTSVDNSILIGYNAKALANADTNEVVLGYDATGKGSNTCNFGNASTTNSYFDHNLNVGNPTNAARLHVKGSGATSATTALLIENSAGTDILTVSDGELVGIGAAPATNYRLYVKGAGTTSSTWVARFDNSAALNIMAIRNDGVVDLVAGYVNSAYRPLQNWDTFSTRKLWSLEDTNAFWGRAPLLLIDRDGVDLSLADRRVVTEGNFETYANVNWRGLDGDAAHVYTFDLTTNGLYGAGTGIVYMLGAKFIVSFYGGSAVMPLSWSARVRKNDGVWTAMTMVAENSELVGVIPITNYVTDIELTLNTRVGAPYISGTTSWSITQVQLQLGRLAYSQGGMITSAGGYFGANVTTYPDFKLGQSTNYLQWAAGVLGLGVAVPTAAFHLKAGTATANTAPLKLTTGPLLTAAEAGAIEFLTDTMFMSPVAGRQAFSGTLFTQTAAATVANTVTETTLIAAGKGSATLPAAFAGVAGKTFRIRARGVYSTTGTPTLRFRLFMGATAIADTTAITAVTATNLGWEVEAEVTFRTIGGSGTVMAQGVANVAVSASGSASWFMGNTATSTIDTTAAQALSVQATWGTASASNTISCHTVVIEALN